MQDFIILRFIIPASFQDKKRSHLLQEGKSFSYMEPKWFFKNDFVIFALQNIPKYFLNCSSILISKKSNTWPDLIQSSKNWLKWSGNARECHHPESSSTRKKPSRLRTETQPMPLWIEVEGKSQWQQQKIIFHLTCLSILLRTRLYYCQQAKET